ncbi:hypothetical protein CEXT_364691 [Caerostris extrusa]|uniref:Uncharacterized protein n=1 Tax=Caerostris extrusa TaxID=172846 RepID=A0AAV4XC27_CAEEX|nr:hypothetical protein CEXT_364691 [Caerostris extrusa]
MNKWSFSLVIKDERGLEGEGLFSRGRGWAEERLIGCLPSPRGFEGRVLLFSPEVLLVKGGRGWIGYRDENDGILVDSQISHLTLSDGERRYYGGEGEGT